MIEPYDITNGDYAIVSHDDVVFRKPFLASSVAL